MNIGETVILNGKEFITVPAKEEDTCIGCALLNDSERCEVGLLYEVDCVEKNYILVEVD